MVGLLSALELMDRGARVTVVSAADRYPPASWAGGGILSPLFAWRYPDAMNRLTADSSSRYRTLVTRLRGRAGLRDDDLNDSGLWVAAEGEEQAQALEWARRWRFRCQPALAQEHLRDGVQGEGLWFPDIGNIRNPRVLKALHEALRQQGAVFRDARVEAVTPLASGGGRLALVDGEALSAPQVLIAAGAWGDRLLAPLGVRPGLFPARGEILLYRVAPGRVPATMLTENGYLIPRADGALLVGSTHHRGDDPRPTAADRAHLRMQAARLLPELASQQPQHHWAGVRPGCERLWPWLGELPGCPGLYGAAGHYRNGLVSAPASAELLAQVICGEQPTLNPVDYAFLP